jgi:DNA-binding protein H-NS
MRAFAASMIALALFAMPVMAAGGAANNNSAAPAKPEPKPANSAAAASSAASPAKPASAEMETELQQLRDALATQAQQIQDQQKKMQQLEELLKASNAVRENLSASPAASAVAASASATAAPVSTVSLSSTAAAAPIPSPAAKAQGKDELGPLATSKIKLGVTFFGDYAFYSNTGFGPQFLTQINQPGPGNDHFNSFDVTRAYLNFYYTPNDKVTLRITPNIYRQVDGTSSSISNGQGASIGGSTNGNLTFRLKYAYVQFNKPFASSDAFGKDHVVIGSETNPLIDWEEGLSGYRYTYLVPWNYLSLSSTWVGAKIEGPIEFSGKEYLDYSLGVYNTASFHSIEQNDKKQVMVRLTWYPFGTTSDRTGFLITGFENYGYNTKAPDTKSTPLDRVATIVSYQTPSKSAQIAFEYDWGRNAFSAGNLFSGAAPAGSPYTDPGGIGAVASAVLAGDRTRQQGFAFFGHYKLGESPFALFGLYQRFQPNTNYAAAANGFANGNPIDWQRILGGLSYHYNDHLDIAVQDSNFQYVHPQGIVGASDTNAIFLNMQFNY